MLEGPVLVVLIQQLYVNCVTIMLKDIAACSRLIAKNSVTCSVLAARASGVHALESS